MIRIPVPFVLSLLVLLPSLLPCPAQAIRLTVQFTGIVDTTTDSGIAPLGATVLGEVLFEMDEVSSSCAQSGAENDLTLSCVPLAGDAWPMTIDVVETGFSLLLPGLPDPNFFGETTIATGMNGRECFNPGCVPGVFGDDVLSIGTLAPGGGGSAGFSLADDMHLAIGPEPAGFPQITTQTFELARWQLANFSFSTASGAFVSGNLSALSAVVVPEPGTALLLLAGLTLLKSARAIRGPGRSRPGD